jgi:hypothetical protein
MLLLNYQGALVKLVNGSGFERTLCPASSSPSLSLNQESSPSRLRQTNLDSTEAMRQSKGI